VREASRSFKFRHYINLHRTEKKLKALISAFDDHEFITCADYIDKQKMALLLAEGYQATKNEGIEITKEFESIDMENWDDY
jgi:hypothetical protein